MTKKPNFILGKLKARRKKPISNGVLSTAKQSTDALSRVWHVVHPHDTIVAADIAKNLNDVKPRSGAYEITHSGKVAHLLKIVVTFLL